MRFEPLTEHHKVEGFSCGERRSLVGLDEVGNALITRLARDRRHAQRGLGAWLLRQAVHRVIDADERLAIRAVVVDALNEQAAT